jgi:hypothetical protein
VFESGITKDKSETGRTTKLEEEGERPSVKEPFEGEEFGVGSEEEDQGLEKLFGELDEGFGGGGLFSV